jgi:putative membrane protein
MILEIILALLIGIIAGSISGIIPGIHINLVSALLLSISTALISSSLNIQPLFLVIFLVSMATAHTFIDFIPSIFLGAPDQDDTALSILPGHEMLTKGQAYEAVIITAYGCLSGVFLILILTPLFFFFLPLVYPHVKIIMPLVLILTSFFLIYFEKTSRSWAFLIFLLSGFLGLASLNLPVKESLLPLFTGLFGISSLITSLTKKQVLPKQNILPLKKILLPKKKLMKTNLASLISAPLCSFLPGMGSGQAAVIGSQVIEGLGRKEFLYLLGSINILVTGLSFVTLGVINKARTGIAVSVGQLITITSNEILWITLTILISGILSFILTIALAKTFTRIINKMNYRLLSWLVLIFLIFIVFLFSGFLGFLLMIVSTLLGLTCIYTGIRRTHLMGCLIIPAIILSF